MRLIAVFAMVRVISIHVFCNFCPNHSRGTIGWFKSEPIAFLRNYWDVFVFEWHEIKQPKNGVYLFVDGVAQFFIVPIETMLLVQKILKVSKKTKKIV